jgi:hypothetical protein
MRGRFEQENAEIAEEGKERGLSVLCGLPLKTRLVHRYEGKI